MRRVVAVVAALLPVVIDWSLKVLVFPRPFWIHFYDPEAIYFYSGLHLLRGIQPENIDNPGTPLQMLSALLAMLTGPSPLHYEQFLLAAHVVQLVATVAAIVLLLRTVFRDAPPLLQVCGGWLYFLAPQALERDDIWSPEALYLPAAAIALALLWRWWKAPSPARAAAVGVAVGVAVALKFVFLGWVPALIATMLAARRVRDSLAAAGSVALGFVIGTLPVAHEAAEMLRRLLNLRRATEESMSWMTLATTSRMWILCAVAIVIVAAIHYRREHLPLFVFSATAVVFTLFGARANPSFRYLLPAALAMIALFAAPASTLRRPFWQVALTALFTIGIAKSMVNDVAAHRRRIDEGKALHAAIVRAVPRDGIVLYSWRVPMPSFALRAMIAERRYHDEIATRWPREGHYSDWTRRIVLPPGAKRWDYLVITPDLLRGFPEPVGATIASVGRYLVVRAPSGDAR